MDSQARRCLNPGKAADNDGIFVEHHKRAGGAILKSIKQLVQSIVINGKVPNKLK